jgi:ABC-type transport system involved in multi-copper enzyme maturation permease subunit
MSAWEPASEALTRPEEVGLSKETSSPFAAGRAAAAGWLERLEAYLTSWGERLNPILVKEARQALKSRRFISTFGLVLLFACAWSYLGVAWMGDRIHFGAAGSVMFYGYYWILAFPLLVVVPFGAFQSLAGERHDGSHELLSITTLKPRQLVTGKLASALLEMLVYLSAVAPCLGFTYLLRGIDFPTILLVLVYTIHASLGLSLTGLLLATVSSERHWQMVLSVLLVIGLLAAFAGALSLTGVVVMEVGLPWHEEEFIPANLAVLTLFWGSFALSFAATAAQLTFAADNRSTALRVAMLANHALFLGWMAYAWYLSPDLFLFIPLLILGYGYWAALGMFLVAEGPDMSHRVRRSLPQTLLGRALFTWLMPGPGTGYMFVLANLMVLGALSLLGVFVTRSISTRPAWGMVDWQDLAHFGCLGFLYIAIYLGLGLWLIGLARRRFAVPLPVGVLLQAVLLILACLVPMVPYLLYETGPLGYSMTQLANPFWTLAAVLDRDIPTHDLISLYIGLTLAAALVFFLNLPRVAYEVMRVQVAKPRRVVEEEVAERPPPALPAAPSSPWEGEGVERVE